MQKQLLHLSDDDKSRLRELALKVDIDFQSRDDLTFVLRYVGSSDYVAILYSSDIAHRRLFAEVGSRLAPWVFFNFSVSSRDSLLGLTDARLSRIAALYAFERDKRAHSGAR